MIHYDLRCGAGHAFDGWFASSASFDAQAAEGMLDCPFCADRDVRRALMAPRLNKGAGAPAEATTPATVPAPAPPPQTINLPMPDQVRAVLQRIRKEVEARCDYVGPKFADTARQIHAGILPERPIYGEATQDEAEALAEDGISVSQIPWVPRADS